MTHDSTIQDNAKSKGVTLPQVLLLLVIVLLLGAASFRVVHEGLVRSLQSHWGRTAEALADGALEMALVRLEAEPTETDLSAELPTGVASARIAVSETPGEFIITYSGAVGSESKIRSRRTYEAVVGQGENGIWKVSSIRRL